MASGLRIWGLGVGVLSVVSVGWMGAAVSQTAEVSTLTASAGWQRVRNFFRQENEDQGAGENRGARPMPGLCLVSPGAEQTIWHRNPVLVWQGYSTVGLRPMDDDDAVLWQATASEKEAGVYRAYYPGEALEPGQAYDWLFYIGQNAPARWFSFQVMEAEQHGQHGAALAALQSELAAQGADEEIIALAKAEYFIENDLPADALQVVFAVAEPSDNLMATQEALVQEICEGE